MLLSFCAVLMIGMTGCGGGGDAASAESAPADSAGGSSGGSADATTTDEEDAAGSLDSLVKLCDVSELSEKASALYPDQNIRCYAGKGKPTSTHQVSDAAWSAGEVNRHTYVIADEHTVQATVEGNEPDDDSSSASFMYDGECYSTTGITCEVQEVQVGGIDCQMRRQVLELEGPAIKSWQVACYLGRDPETGLDVRVQTAATKVEGAQPVEDFTAAVIRAAQGG